MEKGYTVFTTNTFDKVFNSLDRSEQLWILNMKENLETNPTGKILHFSWFREKKYLNKRLYFLIDEETKKILFVAFASKRDQQEIINTIRFNMNELLQLLRSL